MADGTDDAGGSITRRDALKLMAGAGALAGGCSPESRAQPTPIDDLHSPETAAQPVAAEARAAAGESPVLHSEPLGFLWKTRDPFLFCAYHDDRYPAGNEQMGPATSLAGRNLGQDFELRDGFRMYHGRTVPGFPQHPHRGFETVTVVRHGLLDHSDSMGAGARYGGGDVQWMTAGRGIQHAEMFPLLDRASDNRLELFQIWLNLPARDKMVEPHFAMLWADDIPTEQVRDAAGKRTSVTVIAGRYGSARAPSPPPNSWAAAADSDLGMWTIDLEPGARFELPATGADSHRSLYVFTGDGLTASGHPLAANHLVEVRPDAALSLHNGPRQTEILVLQARPIGEPVARRGPFVMNTQAEIQQAYVDYRSTRFGGWPWGQADPVHGREQGRFARHANGLIETPKTA